MNAKGTALASLVAFMEKKFGLAGKQRWMDRLSPQAREIYSERIMISRWYPLREALAIPLEVMCEIFYEGKANGAKESGRFSADYGLQGIYKAMVRIGSPRWVISCASRVISLYYEPSELSVEERGPGLVVVNITMFPDPSLFIEYRVAGWMERALEISGCKGVEVVMGESIARGDKITSYAVSWKS